MGLLPPFLPAKIITMWSLLKNLLAFLFFKRKYISCLIDEEIDKIHNPPQRDPKETEKPLMPKRNNPKNIAIPESPYGRTRNGATSTDRTTQKPQDLKKPQQRANQDRKGLREKDHCRTTKARWILREPWDHPFFFSWKSINSMNLHRRWRWKTLIKTQLSTPWPRKPC